ncbi:RnfH family protein [Alteromonas confluentis]|uniref:UPF0125 protein BFC18_15145 n=1 Tax=Alteromonas confluentis TaxID=1656094 RepID=A0A1E7Z962_9ALTE|nr:RnfH family protein [Alteromonas confluentis]OFC70066.1 RnfH family protein [Alteromonas confluentis]
MTGSITVEVAYALPHKQSLVEVSVPVDSDIEAAINASGLCALHPELDLKTTKVGIWSRVAKLKDSLRDGDRIEIYRPLIADPKEIRKRRAEKAVEEGRADKVTGGRPNPLKSKKED